MLVRVNCSAPQTDFRTAWQKLEFHRGPRHSCLYPLVRDDCFALAMRLWRRIFI
jgi:hypothetical protein